jgi:hypothetical protein
MSGSKYTYDRYGKNLKKVVFLDDDKRYADLKIRLRHDGLTQVEFFQNIVSGYLNNDEGIIEYVTAVKSRLAKQGKKRIAKTRKLVDAGRQVLDDFSLSDDERDQLFDMISEEKLG